MFQVVTSLTAEHDWRLVVLAGAICFLTSVVTIGLFHRAKVSTGAERLGWLGLDAAAAGYGIWATHFIAILAYDHTIGAGYDLTLTILSLVFAVTITGVGLFVAGHDFGGWAATCGGVIVGLGIAAMHYTGMLALEPPGRITWLPFLVVASVAFGVVFGSLALFAAAKREGWRSMLVSAVLLTLAIISTHFTAMAAVVFVPDLRLGFGKAALSPSELSLFVGGAAVLLLGMCLVAALSDRYAKNKLRQQKILLDTAIENMSQGLCMFGADGRIILFNERYSRMLNLPPAWLVGKSLLDVLKLRKEHGEFPGDAEKFFEYVIATIREGKTGGRIFEASGNRTIRVVEQPMQGGGWVATFEDITQWTQAQEQIAHMAHHDGLTNLPNRTLFRQKLEDALYSTAQGEQVVVLCVDLDHFKDVNDTLGHPIGDDLLKQVARRLSECIRQSDTVARLGGDEFVIVQAGCKSTTEILSLANRIVEVIGVPFVVHEHQIIIGASVGISVAPDDGSDPDQLLQNADIALYRAKADGRGTYRFFETGMDARAQARRLLLIDLRAALSRAEFEVYYQPILDVEADKIICFEALIRWNHPLRGIISPADFIPLAEEAGFIIPIGDWVLRKACMDAASWSQAVSLAVNLSPVQFKNRNLVASIISALSVSGLAADRLELEITESVLLQDSEATLAALHKLRDFGVRISMDDFGTGYSSLSYLRSFPFDKIKIDQSFVRDLASRGDSMAIVRAVMGLGKSLGIKTTAEGVETREQLTLLRAEGCTQVQGYFFSRPRPAAEVEKMLSEEGLRVVA